MNLWCQIISKTSILPIRPKTFDSLYRELWLSELTSVNLYALLRLVACRLYLQMIEDVIGGSRGFSVSSRYGQIGVATGVVRPWLAWPNLVLVARVGGQLLPVDQWRLNLGEAPRGRGWATVVSCVVERQLASGRNAQFARWFVLFNAVYFTYETHGGILHAILKYLTYFNLWD